MWPQTGLLWNLPIVIFLHFQWQTSAVPFGSTNRPSYHHHLIFILKSFVSDNPDNPATPPCNSGMHPNPYVMLSAICIQPIETHEGVAYENQNVDGRMKFTEVDEVFCQIIGHWVGIWPSCSHISIHKQLSSKYH